MAPVTWGVLAALPGVGAADKGMVLGSKSRASLGREGELLKDRHTCYSPVSRRGPELWVSGRADAVGLAAPLCQMARGEPTAVFLTRRRAPAATPVGGREVHVTGSGGWGCDRGGGEAGERTLRRDRKLWGIALEKPERIPGGVSSHECERKRYG